MKKGIKGMMTALEKKGVKVCGTTNDFYGCENGNKGIWVAADHTPEFFDYYTMKMDWMNCFGINPKLDKFVSESGWWFEWSDPGTIMVWEK